MRVVLILTSTVYLQSAVTVALLGNAGLWPLKRIDRMTADIVGLTH